MREPDPFSRRRLLLGGVAFLGTAALSGCGRPDGAPWYRPVIDKDEDANLFVQRLLLSDRKLAPEYEETEISRAFKPNGTQNPSDRRYQAMAKAGFKEFRLEIDGLVDRPQALTLTEIRALPSRTQITRHDCVEGWSCIGKWTGVPLTALLERTGLKPQARFLVFHCFDTMDEGGLDAGDDSGADDDGGTDKGAGGDAKAKMTPGDKANRQPDPDSKPGSSPDGRTAGGDEIGNHYYESIDLVDAYHPQTILAYEMNGDILPVAHGAPLRLRLERALGYKMAKYVRRIEVVDSLDRLGKGGGGYWEDQGYEWYAGI